MQHTQQQRHEAALVIIRKAYSEQPTLPALAINADCSAIGAWSKTLGRFVMVASYTITGQWVSLEYELLVNGKHLPQTWQVHPREGEIFTPTVSGKPLTQGQAPMFEPLGG